MLVAALSCVQQMMLSLSSCWSLCGKRLRSSSGGTWVYVGEQHGLMAVNFQWHATWVAPHLCTGASLLNQVLRMAFRIISMS